MFYDEFCKICEKKGLKPTNVVKELKLSSGNMTNWSNGRTPKTDVALRIAKYLGVSVEQLMGEEESSANDEVSEYLEELRSRPEMRMLFSVSKGATKEEIEQAVKIIEALRKND